MHEYGLVLALLERVEREASAHDAAAVHRITVRIGRVRWRLTVMNTAVVRSSHWR
jgi:Zn finger protein HypA/HybF involved in hydrogenase expression